MSAGEPGADGAERGYFPTYEELGAELLDALERVPLSVHDVGHELEPTTGERTFHVAVNLPAGDSPQRYGATIHFHWDALLTYVATYGAGSECELYHEAEEACAHHDLAPRPSVELVAEFDLGDGAYQLRELDEVKGWLETVQGLLARAVPGQEGRTVRLGLGARDGEIWVERFQAEQAWFLELGEPPALDPICRVVAETLKATPALADRLPL